jgi:hypothetical protein
MILEAVAFLPLERIWVLCCSDSAGAARWPQAVQAESQVQVDEAALAEELRLMRAENLKLRSKLAAIQARREVRGCQCCARFHQNVDVMGCACGCNGRRMWRAGKI